MHSAILSAVVATAAASTISPEITEAFTRFTQKYGKVYHNDEWAQRLGVFATNFEKVNAQNSDHLLQGGEAVFGITQFSDMTADEFKAAYLTYKPANDTNVKRVSIDLPGSAASTVDWRTKGALTPVKNQAQCGSCWAFSATEAIESYAFLAGKGLKELSAQQITSCDKTSFGCGGGRTESAYNYVKGAGGLELDSDYPYTSGGGDSGTCKGDPNPAVQITGFTSIAQSEDDLQKALNNGPVSICVAAESFQTYTGGILRSCPGSVDHCVQAVGYNTQDNYWIVRNSWATSWGEEGFIRIAMGENLCQIASDATFPTFD